MTNDGCQRIARIVGVGADQGDGHVRITRGRNFEIYFGSDASHEDMRRLCQRIAALASERGKAIDDLSEAELRELLGQLDEGRDRDATPLDGI
jgi:hypothetical protein